MSDTNIKLQPKDIVDWLEHSADSFGEDGEIDMQNKLGAMADDLKQIFDAAIYGSYENDEAVEQSVQSGDACALCGRSHRDHVIINLGHYFAIPHRR